MFHEYFRDRDLTMIKLAKPTPEEFTRNIGVLSEADQSKLLATRVAIAGTGGVGGIHALTLARLGVGSFNLADMDTFDTVNISRQFGASHSTLGRNKAEVIGEMILDINPRADIKVFPDGISTENAQEFLAECHYYIDGIEFFEVDIRRLLFNLSRQQGIYALTAAPLGFGATLQVFSPTGMSFDEYFGISDEMGYAEKIAAFAAGIAPKAYHTRYIDSSKIDLQKRTGPAVSAGCTLAASFIANEVTKLVTGKGKIRPIPAYMQLDMRLGKFSKGYVLWGAKNPLQRLKRKLALKFFTSAQAGT